MKRVLITGIAGFIGFHLAQALHRQSFFVCGCDHFNAYYSPQLKQQRAAVLERLGISILPYDINDINALVSHLKTQQITHIVHLAAQAGVRYGSENPQAYVHSNLEGFVNVLEAQRLLPHIRLIYASSSSVYGLNTKVPFSEEDPVNSPASLYGATKRSNELLAHSYHHMYGLSCVGLRFFTVYGPWGRPDMAYYSFTQAIETGQALTIFDQGQLKRDFTYIDDIIEGILRTLDLPPSCELFNLGNHNPVSVMELVTLLEQLLQKKAVVRFSSKPPGDVPITYADLTKSRKALGYTPRTSLAEGLTHFVSWYKQYTAQ